jgi:hypothetical protein
MRHLVYNVKCSVVPVNYSLLTITLYTSFITTLANNDTKYSTLSWRYNGVKICLQIVVNIPNISVHKNPFSSSQIVLHAGVTRPDELIRIIFATFGSNRPQNWPHVVKTPSSERPVFEICYIFRFSHKFPSSCHVINLCNLPITHHLLA